MGSICWCSPAGSENMTQRCGPSGRAADQVRASDQPQGREGDRSRRPGWAPAARRQGDRMIKRRDVHANQVRINTLALAERLPTIYANREHVVAAGLMSYGPNIPDLFRRAGDYVDKILRGTKPADIPVEQPTKFDLVINLTTAKALGLTIPESLLARANEVIE